MLLKACDQPHKDETPKYLRSASTSMHKVGGDIFLKINLPILLKAYDHPYKAEDKKHPPASTSIGKVGWMFFFIKLLPMLLKA